MPDALIKWSASYDLGVEEIDIQHRSLVDLLNQVWEGIVYRADRSEVLRVLDELERYTVDHFTEEELYMWEINYPGFNDHTKLHRVFIARIEAEKQVVIQGGDLSLNLVHFLKDWLINHILVQDKAYAEYAQRKPALASEQIDAQDNNEIVGDSLVRRIFKRVL